MDKEYMDKLHSKFSYEEAKSWIKYESLRKRFLTWSTITLFAAATVGTNGLIKSCNINRYKPIGVDMYEQADARLDSAMNYLYYNYNNLSDSSRKAALEDVTELESKKASLHDTEVNQEYTARLRKANDTTMYSLGSGIILAGILAGIGIFYKNKNEKILESKKKELRSEEAEKLNSL